MGFAFLLLIIASYICFRFIDTGSELMLLAVIVLTLFSLYLYQLNTLYILETEIDIVKMKEYLSIY